MTTSVSPSPLTTSGIERVRNYVLSLDEPAAWNADELESRRDTWDLALTDAESALLGELTVEATETFGQWSEGNGTRDEWKKLAAPLTKYFSTVEHSLEGGTGIALLRNLPVRTPDAELPYNENLLWLIGAAMGQPVNQMGGGTVLARLAYKGKARPDHPRAENTNEGLSYHTDGSDLLMLMCIRQAMVGGNSMVSSAARTVKEIARRYPELLPALFEDHYPFDRQMEILDGDTTYYLSRLCTIVDGKITTRYVRPLTDAALYRGDCPPLTERQVALMEVFDEISNEGGVEVGFDSGDLVIANNYSVMHGRSEFLDSEDESQRRLLVRLWLAMENGRPLPFDFDRGVNHDGVARGGVPYTSIA
ncbi:TauD/TfdA family dioxygenase [Mycolicibacterium baixiangningiae]|uniref:TauD/TfdA family dioxygenase n=1 Tax=Mycolicibacterium baixiangningiae TaxID=2761578 RepID=UPI001868DD4E|nr:TauD/TfdA family dioxygenase [Mycolicibacterium baixiangningiae]